LYHHSSALGNASNKLHLVHIDAEKINTIRFKFFVGLLYFFEFFPQKFEGLSSWKFLTGKLGKKGDFFGLGMGPIFGPNLGRLTALT
jgi:hypothetical protein